MDNQSPHTKNIALIWWAKKHHKHDAMKGFWGYSLRATKRPNKFFHAFTVSHHPDMTLIGLIKEDFDFLG